MEMAGSICYASADVAFAGLGAIRFGSKRAVALLHVYCLTDHATNVGAVLADICTELELEFIQFSYLPTPETAESVFNSPEHQAAYRIAQQRGVAYVTSIVADERHKAIDIDQWLD